MFDIKQYLQQLSAEERRRLFPALSDETFQKMVKLPEKEMVTAFQSCIFKKAKTTNATVNQHRWFDAPLCGLSKEGNKQLKELIEQLNSPGSSHNVDRKQVRYLQQLKKMSLSVPEIFRRTTTPKSLYRHLVAFCNTNNIPEEIVRSVIPALVTYMETGHMRPILFVGEKGCGKTTAVKLLVEEALNLPTKVVKIPQTDGGHGMTGDCGTYRSADVGDIAKARLQANSLLVAYIFDEIDKCPHRGNGPSVEDELLSITDESCSDIYDRYLETTLVGLEHCPMFFTANDLQKVSPILADRCTVIRFPNATATRIKSISRKFADEKMKSNIHRLIRFDYDLMDAHIDNLVRHDVTSLREHQQMIEAVLRDALDIALTQDSDEIVSVTEEMFASAETAILDTVKRPVGFMR